MDNLWIGVGAIFTLVIGLSIIIIWLTPKIRSPLIDLIHHTQMLEKKVKELEKERDSYKLLMIEYNEELVRHELNTLAKSQSKVCTPDQKEKQ